MNCLPLKRNSSPSTKMNIRTPLRNIREAVPDIKSLSPPGWKACGKRLQRLNALSGLNPLPNSSPNKNSKQVLERGPHPSLFFRLGGAGGRGGRTSTPTSCKFATCEVQLCSCQGWEWKAAILGLKLEPRRTSRQTTRSMQGPTCPSSKS